MRIKPQKIDSFLFFAHFLDVEKTFLFLLNMHKIILEFLNERKSKKYVQIVTFNYLVYKNAQKQLKNQEKYVILNYFFAFSKIILKHNVTLSLQKEKHRLFLAEK